VQNATSMLGIQRQRVKRTAIPKPPSSSTQKTPVSLVAGPPSLAEKTWGRCDRRRVHGYGEQKRLVLRTRIVDAFPFATASSCKSFLSHLEVRHACQSPESCCLRHGWLLLKVCSISLLAARTGGRAGSRTNTPPIPQTHKIAIDGWVPQFQ